MNVVVFSGTTEGRSFSRALAALGAALVAVDMPILRYAIPAYYILACAEASSYLSRYDGVIYGFRA